MNKTLIVVAIALFFIIYALINFVNVLHDDIDVKHGFQRTDTSSKQNSSYSVNSIGDEILLLNDFSESQKKNIWMNSSLKIEMLDFFPDFTSMKVLVEERVMDDGIFKSKLLEHLSNTEIQYIGGVMDGQSAKAALSGF